MLDQLIHIAERQLARNIFLAGNDFTLADIQLGHVLFRYFDTSIICQVRPALRRFYNALGIRPAFREHIKVSHERLRMRG